jgi:hypothetical protein
MNNFQRANLPTIRINGKAFYKVPSCCDAVRVVFYRNEEHQQEVKVSHNRVFDWCIHGTSTYYVSVKDLSAPIHMHEHLIPNYFTQEQMRGLDFLLTETLLKVEGRK